MQAKFARLFDDAPQVPYETVAAVFSREFGGRSPDGPDGVFAEFEHAAIASASVAQVHRARLWPKTDDPNEPPQWVAVKVQKPAVSAQVEWDLAAFKAVMWIYEHWLFDLPVTFMSGGYTDE
jgi:aarF domain-containing kinase